MAPIKIALSYISGGRGFLASSPTITGGTNELTWMQVLLGAIQGDKLLVILQLSCCPEIGQLVHDRPVVLDELHDVARLQISVDQVVVPGTKKN